MHPTRIEPSIGWSNRWTQTWDGKGYGENQVYPEEVNHQGQHQWLYQFDDKSTNFFYQIIILLWDSLWMCKCLVKNWLNSSGIHFVPSLYLSPSWLASRNLHPNKIVLPMPLNHWPNFVSKLLMDYHLVRRVACGYIMRLFLSVLSCWVLNPKSWQLCIGPTSYFNQQLYLSIWKGCPMVKAPSSDIHI